MQLCASGSKIILKRMAEEQLNDSDAMSLTENIFYTSKFQTIEIQINIENKGSDSL